MAFNAADFIFHVITTTDAEIEERDNDFDDLGTGSVFTVLFQYKPGRNPNAHGFRAWAYATPEERETDFEADTGTGLASNAPLNIIFTPNAPRSASNPQEWLFGQMTARTEERDAFDDDAEDHTYYLKISILQGEQEANPVPGSESVEVSPDETPPGPGHVANFSSEADDEANTITVNWAEPEDDNGSEVTGYETRVRARGTGFSNWEIALFPLVIDEAFLASAIEASGGAIPPGERILIEIDVRAVSETEEEIDGVTHTLIEHGQISRAIWNWPVDVWGPSVPTSFTAIPQEQEEGVIGIDVDLTWDSPADQGNTFIESYEYRYKLSIATFYFDYVSTTSRSATISGLIPATSYDFQVRAKNGAGYYGGNATRTVTTL